MTGDLRTRVLEEVLTLLDRCTVSNGNLNRVAFARGLGELRDADLDTGWRVPTAAELDARVEAMTPEERDAALWGDGYSTGYYERALGRPNRLHPDTPTADAPADTDLREFVDAFITEQLRHARQSVLGQNAYYATCSCGEWRADQPGNYLSQWCRHRDDALLPLVRAQVKAARQP